MRLGRNGRLTIRTQRRGPRPELMVLGLSAHPYWTINKFLFSAHCPTSHYPICGPCIGNTFWNQIVYIDKGSRKNFPRVPHTPRGPFPSEGRLMLKNKTSNETTKDLKVPDPTLIPHGGCLALARYRCWLPFSFLFFSPPTLLGAFCLRKLLPNPPSPP